MTYTCYRSLKASIAPFALVCPIFAVLFLATAPAFGQSATGPGFVIDDWTHHHLVFSNPETLPDATRDKIVNDPRYRMQQARLSLAPRPVTGPPRLPVPTPSPVRFKEGTLEKDWSTSLGGVAATLTGVVGALNSSSISGSSTLTVDSVGLSASPPTAASATGTFSGWPTSATAPTITVNSGAGVITLTNNGSKQTETVQFTGPPLNATQLTIPTTNSALNNLVLTTNGTARQMVGSVGSTPPAANTTISVTAGVSGSSTTTLTNGETGASDQGTFSGPGYNTTAGQITVNNGTSTFTFSPGGTGASVVGTFSNNLPWTGTMHIIVNGGNNLALTPSAGTLATGGAVVASSSTPGAGTITLGNVNYVVSTSGTVTTPGSGTCNVTFTGSSSSNKRNSFRTNLAAAIASPGSGTTSTYECTSATNAYISGATNDGSNNVNLTLSSNYPGASGQSAVNATFADTSGNTSITSFSGGVNGTNGCTNSSAGTIATAPTSATQASNMIAAITTCLGSYPAVGVTATANGSTAVNIISVTPGASDQGLSLATTSTSTTNFGFGSVTNGADGSSNTCSGTTGTYINSTAATTVAPNLAAAMGACSSPGFTASAPSSTVTVTSTAIGSTATLTVNVSNPTDFAWTTTGSVSGSNGSNTCTGTTGTYAYSATAATLAGNIAAALSAAGCSGLGITAVQGNGSNGGSTTQVVVTENTPGTFTTLSGGVANATNIFSWAAASAGTNGTAPACSSATSGSYVTDSSTTNLAANLAAAINLCNTNFPNNVLATANNNSSSTATITASINGTFVLTTATGTNAAMLTIGAPTGGGNGTNACTGSGPWTANFATSATLTTIAADVTSAINACTLGSKGVAAAGNAVVSTTALGTGASLTVGASNNTNIFSWSGVTAGTDGTNSSTTFAYWSVNNYLTPAQVAANIATAVNANTTLQGSTGVSATVSGNDVIFMARVTGTGTFGVTAGSFSAFTPGTLTGGAAATAGKVQPNAYPAKFSFSTAAASCSNDFVVYPTGVAGATGASTIIAYNNLYTSGCSGQVPSVYWEYNTGTGSAVTTSPVLSFFDNTGSQVAFIQVYSGVASLVLLKSAPSTSGTPTTQTAANYPTCTAPCMYTAAFGNGKNDTLSAPFYDYAGDAIYVGDDSGNLHKFTGVFNGAPAEAGGNWPVPLGTNKLSSPVYDATSGHVFVGDMGGELYYVTSDGSTHSPFMAGSPLAALVLGNAIADAPLVDSTKEQVFAFVGSSGTYSWNTYSAVYQSNTNLNAQYPGVTGLTGESGIGSAFYLYAGAFDNVYFQSPTSTGNIYVVANLGGTAASLYRVPVTNGSLDPAGSTAVVTGLTAAADSWPSPVTEFCNGACAITQTTASGCTVSTSSTTVTCTSAAFTSADVGLSITGTDIPSGAKVSTYSSPTSITISADGTGATSSGTVTIEGTTSGTDYVFFSVNRGTPSGCTNTAGHGCILAYNVNNPSAVAISGSGLGVTATGTNGCWATGGIVIDNSNGLTGASQIYFVNLNGENIQTSTTCSTATANVMNATQASQTSP